jgi:alpha-glucosidase
MKQKFFLSFVLATVLFTASALLAEPKNYSVKSPDGKINLNVSVAEKITYAVTVNNKELIKPSVISMVVNEKTELGKNSGIINTETKSINTNLPVEVKVKSAVINDNYNLLRINFKGNFSLEFRAYNDGTAYRFITSLGGNITVNSENVEFNFADDYNIYFPEEESFFTHMERNYLYKKFSQIEQGKFCSIPALVDAKDNIKVAVTEADLFDYPGYYLTPSGTPSSLKAIFPGFPLEVKQSGDRDVPVTKYADYLAETKGKREFPWRVLVITQNDADLLTSQMIYKLATPSKIGNTDWIKPGKVAWDWWNYLNIYGVDFKAGVNTATYKYFIDFASANKLEYIILDEGWYKLGNLFEHNPDINLKEILDYGKEKNVGVILWVIWKTLDDSLQAVLDQFQQMGVKGIKVDFMQRDDQWMVNCYERIAKEAAKRHLLVDFHGAYKPTGLIRTYPNVISSEGVRGNENNKWCDACVNPEHMIILPFIRMLAGPMDYTPGAMLNGNKDEFRVVNNRPMSEGTRCHEMAMYVVYESPLQMLCDSPSNYMKEKECMEFLSAVPSVWDTTVVLDAKVADYAVVARRNGNDWYVGAMTDSTARDFTINFSFLGNGNFKIDYYQDGINADRHASDYKKISEDIKATDKLNVRLSIGGGWAARITRK